MTTVIVIGNNSKEMKGIWGFKVQEDIVDIWIWSCISLYFSVESKRKIFYLCHFKQYLLFLLYERSELYYF